MSYLQGHKLLQTQQPMLSGVFGPGHLEGKKKKNLLLLSLLQILILIDWKFLRLINSVFLYMVIFYFLVCSHFLQF